MSEIMKICVICNFPITTDMMFYQLADLSVSTSIVELKIDGREQKQDDTLCEDCFNKVLKHTIKHENNLKTGAKTSQARDIESYKQRVKDSKIDDNEDKKCVWCSKVKQLLYVLPDGPETDEIAAIIFPNEITEKNDKICSHCWIKIEKIMQTKSQQNEIVEEESNTTPNQYIVLPGYRRVARTSTSCFVVGCKGNERRRVPSYLKRVLLESYKLYLPKSARICNEHIKEYYRDWSFLKDLVYFDELSSDDIEDMMDILGGTK